MIENKYNQYQYQVSMDTRAKLLEQIINDLHTLSLEWKKWISQRIIEFFPLCLLEGLNERLQELQNIHHPRNLFSANAWPLIDDWKIYAIIARTRSNTKLIGAPHAVGHSWLRYFWQRDYEINNLDRYLTWGWKHSSNKVHPFGSPYFAGQKVERKPSTHIKNNSSEILISSAARPTHLLEYPYTPIKFERYLSNQLKVADQISNTFNVKVTIRTRPSDLGWDLSGRVKSLGNEKITIEFQEEKFLSRIKRTKLHICDNASTAAIETLFSNHPTLIYITNDYFELANEVKAEFQILKEAGIFHNDAVSLFSHLKKIIDDIDGWWRSEYTQQCVAQFLLVQGNHKQTIKSWSRALLAKV